MERVYSHEAEMRGIVRYKLDDGRMIDLDAMAVREFGAAALLRSAGVEVAADNRRLPVIQNGRTVGYLPADFDPFFTRSKSFLYDLRPGDFRRDGDKWAADRTLEPGDFDMVPGFSLAQED